MLGGMWPTPGATPAALLLLLSLCCCCCCCCWVLSVEKLLLAFVRCSLPPDAAAMRGLLLCVLPKLTSSSTDAADLQQQKQTCKQWFPAVQLAVKMPDTPAALCSLYCMRP
jgi:hypothetical protein